jgi:predicted transcriptional regulator
MENTKRLSEIFGLSKHESAIYLALVNLGPSTISQISRTTGLPRTALYSPTTSLLKNGFLFLTSFGKRKYYNAIRPEKLKHLLEQKTVALNSVISDILPSDHIISRKNDLDISYFPGQHGIMTAGQLFIDETTEKTWYSFENPVHPTDLVGIDFEKSYIENRVEKSIASKMILSAKNNPSWLTEFIEKDKKQLRETLIISPVQYGFESTIAATKGLVIMINAKENPFAVLIRNNYLAFTIINIHRIIWDRYKL